MAKWMVEMVCSNSHSRISPKLISKHKGLVGDEPTLPPATSRVEKKKSCVEKGVWVTCQKSQSPCRGTVRGLDDPFAKFSVLIYLWCSHTAGGLSTHHLKHTEVTGASSAPPHTPGLSHGQECLWVAPPGWPRVWIPGRRLTSISVPLGFLTWRSCLETGTQLSTYSWPGLH